MKMKLILRVLSPPGCVYEAFVNSNVGGANPQTLYNGDEEECLKQCGLSGQCRSTDVNSDLDCWWHPNVPTSDPGNQQGTVHWRELSCGQGKLPSMLSDEGQDFVLAGYIQSVWGAAHTRMWSNASPIYEVSQEYLRILGFQKLELAPHVTCFSFSYDPNWDDWANRNPNLPRDHRTSSGM